MEVFRITKSKWADKLVASGYPARWNSKGFFIIYSAENCSLACLENLVHRNGFGFDADFSLITISVPTNVKKVEISEKELPIAWNNNDEKAYLICQQIGDNWLRKQSSCILIVPSAIIANEKNILINPNHPDFIKIVIQTIQPFNFDKRLGIF
jgi:RES domain-containing protein